MNRIEIVDVMTGLECLTNDCVNTSPCELADDTNILSYMKPILYLIHKNQSSILKQSYGHQEMVLSWNKYLII